MRLFIKMPLLHHQLNWRNHQPQPLAPGLLSPLHNLLGLLALVQKLLGAVEDARDHGLRVVESGAVVLVSDVKRQTLSTVTTILNDNFS